MLDMFMIRGIWMVRVGATEEYVSLPKSVELQLLFQIWRGDSSFDESYLQPMGIKELFKFIRKDT